VRASLYPSLVSPRTLPQFISSIPSSTKSLPTICRILSTGRPGIYWRRKRAARMNPSLREGANSAVAVGLVPEVIFVFHRHAAVKSGLKQDGKELRPVDQPLAWDAISPPILPVNSDLLQDWLDDLRIFQVDGKDANSWWMNPSATSAFTSSRHFMES